MKGTSYESSAAAAASSAGDAKDRQRGMSYKFQRLREKIRAAITSGELSGKLPGERALANAGWLPFHTFDRQIVQRDVEVVGGLAGADGMCRPTQFNVFVFVNSQLAGTLSPSEMDSRTDGSIGGGIRLADDETIAADFARYTSADPLCCPSGRVTVRYRIDRTASPPVVVPVRIQPTRQ